MSENVNFSLNHGETKNTDFQFGRWLSSPPPVEEVVVSGMSGKFPESNNIFEYRDNLMSKKDMVTSDGRRWKLDHPEIPQRAGKIFNIDKMDSGFFGLHYRQADIMDPLLRILLETAVECIMDAGVNPSELKGSKTGVLIASSWSESETAACDVTITEPHKFAMTGCLRSFLAHRLSYYLQLRGPSLVFDAACSSSLNALDQGVKAIRTGQCDNVLVGTAHLVLNPGNSLQFFRLGIISADGVTKSFDHAADGYARAETIACVFLQKAKNSRRIYAKIIHSKVNSDGYKDSGITFPSVEAQTLLLTEIYDESGIDPSSLSYFEAHATGTQVGDPQETEAIDCALAQKRQKPLLVGSVKSNIGHPEEASGICSLVKILIAMETGKIAPNIHLKKIKEGLKGFEEGRMTVVTEVTDLEGEEAIVGFSNLGFGGNNGHMILQRFGKVNKNFDDFPRLVCVSGRTEEAVLTLLRDLSLKPLDIEYIALLHHIYKINVDNHIYRGFRILSKEVSCNVSCDLVRMELRPLLLYFGELDNRFKIWGLYCLNIPVFKNTLQRINNVLLTKNIDILDVIFIKPTNFKERLLGAIAVQIGIVDVVKCLELQVTAVYGDFLGKLVTAYYYDVITLEETVLAALKITQNTIIKTVSKPDIDNILKEREKFSKLNAEKIRLFNVNNSLFNGKTFREYFINREHYEDMNNSNIVNVSDVKLGDKDFMVTENSLNGFLEILGRLYKEGYNLQLHKLYSDVEYPVGRNTPLLSPMIKWNHEKSWYAIKFRGFTLSDAEQLTYKISPAYEEYRFLEGHVIDGRNLFPATEYLNLAWKTFAQSRRTQITDVSIVFENCKFVRAVLIPKNRFVTIVVNLQRDNGYFEVLENDSLVMKGRIYTVDKNEITTNLPPPVLDEQNRLEILEQDEIYREMYVRGYNYGGLFKGLVKCNADGSAGLIKWENNWSTFIDKMLQIKILQNDTRLLYVPTGIKKLIIDSAKHLAIAANLNEEKQLIPVSSYKENDVIKSGGIQIWGLHVKSISKKKQRLEPVLEKYEFCSNKGQLDVKTAVRINAQIIQEHSLDLNFKAVEIPDVSTEYLLPLVSEVLDDLPLIVPDLTISIKEPIEEIPGVKMEDYVLLPESNLLLAVVTNIFQKPTLLKQLTSALRPGGFILTRETLDASVPDTEDFKVFTKYKTVNEKIFLLKKTEQVLSTKFIEVSSNNLDWLLDLQNAKMEPSVVLYANNKEPNGIMGLINALRLEPNGKKIRCLFMMDHPSGFSIDDYFCKKQLKKQMAVNICRNSQWGTYRHLLLDNPQEIESEHCYVNIINRGDLSSLRWLEGNLTADTPLENNNLLIRVYYAALNFRDVMTASGRIGLEFLTQNRIKQEGPIGMEFSGTDLSGRRVVGISAKALATLTVADNNWLWEIPDDWSLEEGATVPVVYATVGYALLMVANLRRDTSILIHSGTGGIGLAAVNICRHFGCEIFVTVGTQEKRDYLKKMFPEILDDHIGNSRDTSFEEMVKVRTEGRGVDVVLNSLADDKLKASVRCLARGGYFMEIGKFDLANDTSLGLLFLERNVSYHGIMLDKIFLGGSETKTKIRQMLSTGMREGWIKPLPRVIYNTQEVETAFRYMTAGTHIGKVLIKIRDDETTKISVPKALPRFNCRCEKSYIVVGGLGGVGLELADWLCLRGAKSLVLSSRTGVQTGYQTQRIRIWKSYGVNVHISTSDVTTAQGCHNLIGEALELGPVEGVFNLAVVLQDALFEDQTPDKFFKCLAPKVDITRNLDQLTRTLCPDLRYFVVFSSVSCGRGNIGQSNYAMANSIMERICENRKNERLPALAVQWGAIGDVGLVAKMQKENKELVIGGTLQQKISSCLEVLDRFLTQESTIVSSMLVAEKHGRNYGSLSAVETVAEVLGIKDIKTVSQHATLAELGMDSLMSTEAVQVLETDYDIYLTSKEVRSLTFAKLAEIDAQRNNNDVESTVDKRKHGINFLIQYIPDSQITDTPVVNKICSQIADDEEGNTVLLLPGIDGVLAPLEKFVKTLKAHVYGVQYEYKSPEDSVEEMAESIFPHIRELIDANNTYCVIGYSFGVNVALELISLLESKGYTGKLIAIEGSPTYLNLSVKQYYCSDDNEDKLQTTLFLGILAVLLPVDVLAKNQHKFMKCKHYDERLDLAQSLVAERNLQKLEKQAANAFYKRFKATLKYSFTHDKIKSAVHLLKAKFPMITDQEDDYKLSTLCEEPVVVDTLDGDHVTILDSTNIAEIVNALIQ